MGFLIVVSMLLKCMQMSYRVIHKHFRDDLLDIHEFFDICEIKFNSSNNVGIIKFLFVHGCIV